MNAALLLIAVVTLATATAAFLLRRVLHTILALSLTWIGIAAFYFWAGVQFLAFAQVLVYLGAISMAVLFAVLLTRRSREEPPAEAGAWLRRAPAVAAAAALFGVLLYALHKSPVMAAGPDAAPTSGVRDLGLALMDDHPAALLAVGVLLTAALVGAVVLAADDRDEAGEDKP